SLALRFLPSTLSLARDPRSLAATLAALPSMSHVPRAPFYFLLCNFYFGVIGFAFAADPPITEDELVRRTQELYDSIVSGNQTPWKKYFADDCTFSDEKGRTFDKTKLVADITPLPKGYSG